MGNWKKRCKLLFSEFSVGDLIEIFSYDHRPSIPGRLIALSEKKRFIYQKPNPGMPHWTLYEQVPNGSYGMYIGRHEMGAVVLINEKRYQVAVEYLRKIRIKENE